MDDPAAVEVVHAQHELAKEAARLVEREAALLDEVVEQLAAGAELGDEVDGRLGRDELEEGEDVGVAEAAVVVQLAGEEGEGRAGVGRLFWRSCQGGDRYGGIGDRSYGGCKCSRGWWLR